MKRTRSIRDAISILASVSILVACSGPSAFTDGPEANGGSAATISRALSHSWMKSPASGGNLLYVSDPGAGVVDVFSYPQGALVGTLTGFSQPMGVCSNPANGDVWITDEAASQIVGYAHGGTTPIGTLSDTGERPYSCAFQRFGAGPVVANISSVSGGPGSIFYGPGHLVYPHGFAQILYLCYPRAGTDALFLDGLGKTHAFKFAEFPPHRRYFYDFKLPVTINTPGVIAFDGPNVDVADQSGGPGGSSVVYRFIIKKEKATLVGSVQLSTAVNQFSIFAGTLIGPYTSGGKVGFWNFPAGGSPTRIITGLVKPFGAAISKASAE